MGQEERASPSQIVWSKAAQGDILDLSELHYVEDASGPPIVFRPELGVVLMSQTCDLVRALPEDRVLIAPVRHPRDAAEASAVRDGKKPLLVLVGEESQLVAEMDRIVSVPRKRLDDSRVVQRTCATQSGEQAARLASRLARSISRFAFPDGDVEALRKLQTKVLKSWGKNTRFAETLALVDEFRVASTDWDAEGSELTVYAIIGADALPDAGAVPPNWAWSLSTVTGLKSSEQQHELKLERVSELIILNLEQHNDAALVRLWELWGQRIEADCLTTGPSEARTVDLVVVSGDDLRYTDYVTTQPLDFSALSQLDA